MDKIQKFLKKLSAKQLEIFILLIEQIELDHNKVPGIKKLAGKENLYRVRIGQYRIIFQITARKTEIIRITKRDDKTYKDL